MFKCGEGSKTDNFRKTLWIVWEKQKKKKILKIEILVWDRCRLVKRIFRFKNLKINFNLPKIQNYLGVS
jgi:hypothetical protein